MPSKVQLWLWECFTETCRRVREIHRKQGGPLHIIANGDLVDGLDHHGTTEVIGQQGDTQQYIAQECFGPLLDLKPDRLLVTRGTEAHGGKGGAYEEMVAHWIKAERDPETTLWSRWHLRMRVHGRLWDIQHHGKGLGRLPWTKQNGANGLAQRVWMGHALRGMEPPALVVRSHLHQFADSHGANPHTRAIFLPSFQVKTAYAHKVAADDIADVGAVVVVTQPDGEFAVTPVLFAPALPKIV